MEGTDHTSESIREMYTEAKEANAVCSADSDGEAVNVLWDHSISFKRRNILKHRQVYFSYGAVFYVVRPGYVKVCFNLLYASAVVITNNTLAL